MRLPLRRLQEWQHATRFSQVELPPRERGVTWSSVNSEAGSTDPQYWQVLRSRSRMFLRESARVWCGMRRYSSSRITEGTRIESRAACRKCPFSSSVMATPFSTRTIARRAAQTLMGSYDAFSTSTGACITVRRTSGCGAVLSIMTARCVMWPECLCFDISLCVRNSAPALLAPIQARRFSFQYARHRCHVNSLRSRAQQHARALRDRSAGGEHIINQQHVSIFDVFHSLRARFERSAQVRPPLVIG